MATTIHYYTCLDCGGSYIKFGDLDLIIKVIVNLSKWPSYSGFDGAVRGLGGWGEGMILFFVKETVIFYPERHKTLRPCSRSPPLQNSIFSTVHYMSKVNCRRCILQPNNGCLSIFRQEILEHQNMIALVLSDF